MLRREALTAVPPSGAVHRRAVWLGLLAALTAILLGAGDLMGVGNAYAADGVTSENGIFYTIIGGQATVTSTVEAKNFGGVTTILATAPDNDDVPVVAIAANAFAGASNVGTLSIPDSVRTIGDAAFVTVDFTSVGVTSVVFGTGDSELTTIGDYAFSVNGLTSVTLPDTLTTVGNGAFSDNNLTSVTLPDALTTVGAYAFATNSLTSVTLPDNLETISAGVFMTNGLTSVTLPDKLKTIGTYAFSENSLTSVIVPGNVTAIGDNAFSWNSLTSLTLPEKLEKIGISAFSGNRLTSLIMPASVSEIKGFAFFGNDLTSVIFRGRQPTLGNGTFNSGAVLHYPASETYLSGADNWGSYSLVSYLGEGSAESSASTTIKPGARNAALEAVNWNKTSPSAAAWSGENLKFSHTATAITGTMLLSVDDQSGSGAGWAVTVQASNFVWSASSNSAASSAAPIANTALTIGVGSVRTVYGDPGAELTPAGSAQTMDASRIMLTAAPDNGEGAYTSPLTLALTVPTNARAGTYTATLTTTMSVSW